MLVWRHHSARTRDACCWAVVAILACPSAASAETNADGANAAASAAREAFEKGDHDAAVKGFLQAYSLEPRSVFLFWIGHIQGKAERLEEAIASYERFIKDDPESPKRAQAEASLKALLARVEREMPFVEIASTPTGASLMLDRAEVGRTPWRGRVRVGAHALFLSMDGHQDHGQTVVVELSRPMALTLALEPATAAPRTGVGAAQPEVKEEARSAEEDAPGDHELYAWIGLGIGGAAAAATGVFLYLWRSDEEAANSADRIDDRDKYQESADTNLVITQLMAGIAVAGIGTGIYFSMFSPDTKVAFAPTNDGFIAVARF